MSTTTTTSVRVAAVLAGATLAVGGHAGAPAATAAGPDAGGHPHRTALTLAMPACDGCVVQLFQGTGAGTDHPSAWISRERRVRDGAVTWRVPSRRTQGMSITIRAPWEGELGYVTTVAVRYGGETVGDRVTFREARAKRRAAACWEGTRRDAVTLPVVVRRVRVQGTEHRVPGTIAYLRTTESWLTPLFPARRGVLGLQDVPTCV